MQQDCIPCYNTPTQLSPWKSSKAYTNHYGPCYVYQVWIEAIVNGRHAEPVDQLKMPQFLEFS